MTMREIPKRKKMSFANASSRQQQQQTMEIWTYCFASPCSPVNRQTRHRYKRGLDDVLVFCLSLLKSYDANSGYWDPWRLSKIGSDTGCALLVFCGALPTAFFKSGWIASTWAFSMDNRRGKKQTLLLEAWCTMRHRRSCVDPARSSVVHKRQPRKHN